MQLTWLEDFGALAEHGSVSKAAVQRTLTQAAFSRRTRAWEGGLAVELCTKAPSLQH
jgi:DNA-binding transcriptional LysR family regulator